MANKISGPGLGPSDAASTRRTERVRPAGDSRSSAKAGAAATGDTVNLTRSGLLLNVLEEKLRSIPVVDAGRVRALQHSIESGGYRADPESIADKMIETDRGS